MIYIEVYHHSLTTIREQESLIKPGRTKNKNHTT